MRVAIYTVSFDGLGHIDCRRCSTRVVFPDDCSVILQDLGSQMIVVNADSSATLHRCGMESYWKCLTCNTVSEPVRRRKFDVRKGGRGGQWWDTSCPTCEQPMSFFEEIEPQTDVDVLA